MLYIPEVPQVDCVGLLLSTHDEINNNSRAFIPGNETKLHDIVKTIRYTHLNC